jgi:apolipoprotein N-acyltransferase
VTGDGGRRRGSVALPSLAAGALLALSLPPWGWWPLAFVGAAVLYLRLAGLRPRTRFLAGWLAGLGCFIPGLWWVGAFTGYGAMALMAIEALSTAVAAAVVPPRRGRLPAYAGAFTLLEAVRMTWPFGGLPIGGVFLGQAGGPLLGAARLGGPLLLTALVWLGGAGLGELATAVRRAPAAAGAVRRARAAAGAVVACSLIVVVAAVGALAPDGGTAVGHLGIAAVQGGGRRGVSEAEVDPSTVFDAQLAATRAVDRTGAGRPALVVWPEDVIALTGLLAGSPQAATMSALARRLRATVVAGVTEVVSVSAFRNEVVAWGPTGRVAGTFEKVHRVPFGEYVPYRGFFARFANLSKVPLDAVPGRGTGLLRTPAAPLGVLISYEVFYADRSRASVRAGAELLVVPTNTSSYATDQIPSVEVAADRIQAVEAGRSVVQAAPAGFTSVVDEHGDVLRQSALGRRQVVTATVALRRGWTLYVRFGDLPTLALSGLALVAGWLRARVGGSGADRNPAVQS